LIFGSVQIVSLQLGGPRGATGVAKARAHQIFGGAPFTGIAQSRSDFLGLTGHVHGGWRLPEFLFHVVG
jgi:hypothetical protein